LRLPDLRADRPAHPGRAAEQDERAHVLHRDPAPGAPEPGHGGGALDRALPRPALAPARRAAAARATGALRPMTADAPSIAVPAAAPATVTRPGRSQPGL